MKGQTVGDAGRWGKDSHQMELTLARVAQSQAMKVHADRICATSLAALSPTLGAWY